MNFKSAVQVILLRETHLLNKMGLSQMKINLKTNRHAKHILSQTGLGKLRKSFRINFYTEESFMSDKFNIVDYYNTIIKFIRKMLN